MNYSLNQNTFAKKPKKEIEEELKQGEKKDGKNGNIVGQKRAYKYVEIEPIQGPINAPYKQFMEMRNDLNNN